jgi:diguanylate cyclase (GGDEF)-like protein/PAS domain S-box-containing protein
MVTAVYGGGLAAGLLATALACIAVTVLWPLFSVVPFVKVPADWLGVALFVLTGVLVSSVAEAMWRANRRAELAKKEAELANQSMQLTLEALTQSERFIKSIADALPGLMAYWDKDLTCRFANKGYMEWFGKSPQAVIGHTIQDLMGEHLFALNEPYIRGALAGQPQSFERTLTKANGRIGYTWANYIPDLDSQGSVSGFYVLVSDITQLKEAEADLRLAAAAFNTQEAIVITDAKSVILRVNQAFTEITGFTAAEVIGQTPRILKSTRHNADFYRAMWEIIGRTGGWQGEIWDRRKNGEEYPKWLTISAVKDDHGVVTHYVGTHFDITERKKAEEQINELAFFDQLTGLPNRTLLLDRLRQIMATNARSGSYGALLFIDLDNFKTLNDTLGHDKGDLLLQEIAKRLLTCIRQGDTAARLGGDEFVVMLNDLGQNINDAAIQAKVVGEKVLAMLNHTHLFNGHEHHSTASIGLTLLGNQVESLEEILKQADLAMYQAKSAGRSTLRFFDPEMQTGMIARVALEKHLRTAVCEEQFILHYQPQIDTIGQCTGAEVLIRWQSPQSGLVFPDAFIPLAEETGLILPMGNWVLATACAQLAAWSSGKELAHLTLAVNISGRQLRQFNFVEQVLTILEQTGASPEKLKLELTESHLLTEVEDTIAKMTALRSRGVNFALDDFGTGYSSLSYLKRLPLEKLKIDKSFVMDVLSDPNDAAIAKTIVALAQALGLEVIAEGVETVEQRNFLAENGCRWYQGYFFSRPLPLHAFEEFARGN